MALTRRSLPPEWQADWMVSTFVDTEGCINIVYWPREVAIRWGRYGGDFPTEPKGIWGIRLTPYLASIVIKSLVTNMTMLFEEVNQGPSVEVTHRNTDGMGQEIPPEDQEAQDDAFDRAFWAKQLGDLPGGPMEPSGADGY